jgi:hypothetical protein
MERSNRHVNALATALLLVSVVACGKKDNAASDTTVLGGPDTTAASVAPAPLSVTDVQVGKSIGSDKKVTSPGTSFGVRDTVYASVTTNGASSGGKLTAKWTYNGPTVINESSQTVNSTGGESVTEFHITKRTAWPKGSYRVEVSLDGAPARTVDFEIK